MLALDRPTDDARLIPCACGQALAREHANGDIEPIITGARWNKEGWLVIKCPVCNRDRKLPVRRVA